MVPFSRFLPAGLLAAHVLVAQIPVFRTFDGRSGLPQSQVNALLEDRQGFLWVGTHAGVARMGASGIQTFGLAQGMGVGRVWDFLEDPDGGLWVAQEDANLALIRGSRVKVFGAPDGLEVPYAHALALDAQGRVLVGTRQGLWRLDRGRFSKIPLGVAWDEASIQALKVDRTGDLWIGSHEGRLARLHPGGGLEETALPEFARGEGVLALGQPPGGDLLVATRSALLRRTSRGEWVREPLEGAPAGARLEGFQVDGRGNLLVYLGAEGLWMRDATGAVRRLTSRDGLPEEAVTAGLLDRHGILWVGTDGQGLQVQPLPGLTGLRRLGADPIGPVVSLAPEGPVTWVGSSRGLLRVEEGRGVTGRWGPDSGLPGREVRALAPDGKGGLWVGTVRGLVSWRQGRVQGPVLLPGAVINQALAWQGGLAVATGEGLALRGRDGALRRFHLPAGLGGDLVYCLLPDGDGLILGTHRGLFRWREGALEPLHREAPFAQLRVICLARDSAGALWVGTVRGLFKGEGGRWSALGVAEGLPDSHIYFIQPLSAGRLAIGHGQGVTLLDPRSGMVHLNQNLGLFSDETNRGCVFLDGRERLWFGQVEGFCRLDLRQPIQVPRATPPLVMEARWQGGEAFQPTRLALPPGAGGGLQLDFQVGQAIAVRPPRFEVQMEGLGAGWQPVGTDHLMRFGALPGGSYRFRVRASQDGAGWVEGPPLALEVAPAWHEQPWGRLGLAALALGLAALGVRWRTRRLRAQAQNLEQIVAQRTQALVQRNLDLERAHAQIQASLEAKAAFTRMVAHDLRSPLTTLLLVGEELVQDLREGRSAASRAGVLLEETHRIEALLQRLLDQAKADSFLQSTYRKRLSARQVLEGLPEVLKVKAEGRRLRFTFEEADACGRAWVEVDPLGVQQVVLNLMGNAFKFTEPGGEVGLRSRVEAGRWVMEAWDSGRGMDESQVDQLFRPFRQGEVRDAAQGWGLGLGIVRALVEGHGGVLSVRSAPGQGSTFRVEVPLAR